MKVNMIKMAGGMLVPANESEAERMKRFKNNCAYEVELKQSRNYEFHKKVFAFFNFCFEHYVSTLECAPHERQFEVFRNELTVLAGYYDTFYTLRGSVRVEAKSLSYGEMNQEEIEQLYSALINASLKHVFNNTKDQNIISQLYGFF